MTAMVTTRSSACVVLTIVLFALSVLGCASTGTGARTGTSTPVAVKDVSSLAGKWTGWIQTTGGGSKPATLEITPSGDYKTQTEGAGRTGKVQLKDGGVVLVSTSGSGRLATSAPVSNASVSEGSGVLIMRGSGRDDIGPFEFEFTKSK